MTHRWAWPWELGIASRDAGRLPKAGPGGQRGRMWNPWPGRRCGGVLLLAGLMTGCGDGGSGGGSSSRTGNAATAPLDYLAVQGQAKKHSEGVAALSQVQQALQQYRATEDRWPERLDDLVRAGLLARLPAMPAGQRLDYDPRTGAVRVAR